MSSDDNTCETDSQDSENEDQSTDSDGPRTSNRDKIDEKPLQLLRFHKSSGIETPFQISVNDSALNELAKKCLNYKVCTICITGHRRSGKSVLANYLLYKLRNMKSRRKDWVTDVTKLTGFQFPHGYKSNSEGIWVWSRPFLVETDDETIAVIIMETQGIDDELLSTEEKLALTGISLLVSSLMIVNLIDDTVEDLVDWLAPLFNHCSSKSISEFNTPPKLSVLIRDWTKLSQYGHGEKGGSKLLKERRKQNKDLENCISYFQDGECFLLHHIGEKAAKKSFVGNSNDITTEFSSGLAKFINALVDPDVLPLKTFFGNPVSFVEFKHFLVGYHNVFNQMFLDDCLETKPENIFRSTLESAFDIKISKALDQLQSTFQRQAKQSTMKYFRESTIESIFVSARKKSLQAFREFRVPKAEEKNLETRFEQLMLAEKQKIKNQNECSWRKIINDKIQNIIESLTTILQSEYPLSPHYDDTKDIQFYDDDNLSEYLSLRAKNAIGTFMEYFKDEDEQKHHELQDLIDAKLQILTSSYFALNHQCQLKAAERADRQTEDLLKKYIKTMNEHLECQDVKVEDLHMFHKSAMKKIERKFNQSRKISPSLREKYWSHLKDKIQQNMDHWKTKLAPSSSEILPSSSRIFDPQRELDVSKMEHKLTNKVTLNSGKVHNQQSLNLAQQINTISEQILEAFEIKIYTGVLQYDFDGPAQIETYLLDAETKHLGDFDKAALTLNLSDQDSVFARTIRGKLLNDMKNFQNNVKESEVIYRQCINELVSKMTKAVAEVSDSETLLKEHMKCKSEVIKLFKDRCHKSNEPLFLSYVQKIEKKSEESLTETKDFFDMKTTAKNAKILAAKLEAKITYQREMDHRFQSCSNGYFTDDELSKFHKQVESSVLKTISSESGLNEHQSSEIRDHLRMFFEDYWKKNELMEKSHHDTEPAIGIDLGTTYCCMGVFLNGKVQILRSSNGSYTTPSYVTIHENGNSVIGQTSKNLAFKYPGCTIFDVKRIIGRQVDDEELQNDLKFWPFSVELNENKAQIRVHEKLFQPEEITSILLKHLKEEAEKILNLKVSKAVITVPAYFTDGQRKATIKAGEMAGIEVLGILNEPSAAATAYRHEFFRENRSANIIVYDLGGGTFDVAVLKMSKDNIEVLSIQGDSHLGGEDFDKNMMNFCAEQFYVDTGIDIFEGKDSEIQREMDDARRSLRRLQSQCEIGKKELATALSTTISIAAFMKGHDLDVEISRDEFEEINDPYFEKTIEIVEQALTSANIRKDQIQEVILNGGSSRIPKLQAMLESYFNDKPLNRKINPDEAVAHGAAIHAAMLNAKPNAKIFDFGMIQEVTPMSLGIKTLNDEFDVIIPKNSKIPTEQTQQYHTSFDGQTTVIIEIYQGESEKASENKFLGNFTLEGIPKEKAKHEKVVVTIKIDQNGVLHVEAASKNTKKSIKITVNEDQGRVGKKQKERLLESAT